MKAPSPLLGFNNNVRHKGRVFHIQTEDSGIRHPHIITHLFADGGRILKTTKTSYVEHLGHERLAETVRAMMQDQHKAMFIALRDGQFDYLFEEGGGAQSLKVSHDGASGHDPRPKPRPPVEALAAAPTPSVLDQGVIAPAPVAVVEPPPVEVVVAPAPVAVVVAPAPVAVIAPAPVAVIAAPPVAVIVPPPHAVIAPPFASNKVSIPRPVAHFAPTEPAQPAAVSPPPPPLPPRAEASAEVAPVSPRRKRGVSRPTLDVDPGAIHGVTGADSSIDLDLDALERAAAEAQTPFFQQIQDLPPPPAAVLGSKRSSTGGYSVRSPMPPPPPGSDSGGGYRSPTPGHDGASRPQAPQTSGHDGASRPQSPAGHRPRVPSPPAPAPSPGRYAPSRPASIFATTRPQEGASIFGEDLISEKSLDEVILGYLAEDLDGPAEKK